MKIRRDTLSEVWAHARESCPRECCGILLAKGRDRSVADLSLRAENVEQTNPETGYVLGHRSHLEAVAREAAQEVRIVGYYHSHPGGSARPSQHDLRQAVPGITYLIVARRASQEKAAAWRLAGDHWSAEPLEVIE